MSADDFQNIGLPDYSSDDSLLGDDPLMGSISSSQSISSATSDDESCPYCHSSFESLGCDYQEHVQECAASCPLPLESPPSQSSISRLRESVSKYQAQFHGLGLHRRLQMMEALHRLARRCTTDSPFSDLSSPISPEERKTSPTQDLDKKVFKMVWTRPTEKDQDQKEKTIKTPTSIGSSVLKKDGELFSMKHGLKRKTLTPISTTDPVPPLSPRKSVKFDTIDPITAFLKEPQTPLPELPSGATTSTPLSGLEESGFGTAILSPLDSPSGFDFSLSPPKESLGTAFFLTPSQSTSSFSPKFARGSDVHWARSQHYTHGQASSFPNFSAFPSHYGQTEPRSQEDVLKYLISQYQLLLSRTDAFLRTVDPKSPDMRCSLPTPSGTESLLEASSMIQQLASLSSKKLQESFSQVAKLQEQISQCQSNLFQAPNSLRKGPTSIAQSLLGLATLAKAQEQLKSSLPSNFSRSWI